MIDLGVDLLMVLLCDCFVLLIEEVVVVVFWVVGECGFCVIIVDGLVFYNLGVIVVIEFVVIVVVVVVYLWVFIEFGFVVSDVLW